MPTKSDFRQRFIESLPRLLNNAAFKDVVLRELSEEGPKILERVKNKLPLDDENEDCLYDVASNAFSASAKCILSLGWDGDAPGMSGASWLNCFEEVYVVESSDYAPSGPFSSLEEALREECFRNVTANPELDSEILPLTKLLAIAREIVDWENDGKIRINEEMYKVLGDELVRADEPDDSDCELRDEDGGEAEESPTSGTVIDPEDGLFQGMEELKAKLGPEKFIELLLKEFPLRPEKDDSNKK